MDHSPEDLAENAPGDPDEEYYAQIIERERRRREQRRIASYLRSRRKKADGRLLRMDFTPVFMAGYALRVMQKHYWEKVRTRVVPHQNPRCAICSFTARERRSLIHAHEIYTYPGPPIAILTNIMPLCVYCHEATHYDDLVRRSVGKIREQVVREHYCRVNDCTEREFRADYDAAEVARAKLESLYGVNNAVELDYGRWRPPPSYRPPVNPKVRLARRSIGDFLAEYGRKHGGSAI